MNTRRTAQDTYWHVKNQNRFERISVANMEYTHIESIRRKILSSDRSEWFGRPKTTWINVLESELRLRNSLGNNIIYSLDKIFTKADLKAQFKQVVYNSNQKHKVIR